MLPLSDGIPARRFPTVNVLLIVANFAVWIFYELPQLNTAVYHASSTRARSTTPATGRSRGASAGSPPCFCTVAGITSWATCCSWRSSARTSRTRDRQHPGSNGVPRRRRGTPSPQLRCQTPVAEICIGRRIGYSQSCYSSSAVMISSLRWMLSNDRQVAAAVGLDQPAWPLRCQVDSSRRRSNGRGGTGSRRAEGVAAGPA